VPFAVPLDLDPLSAAALAPLLDAVERADPKATTPRRAGVAMHVSLAVDDRLDVAAMIPSLQRFAGLQPACDVQLSSLGLFPGPALFAAPVVAAELLELHGRFHHAVASFVPHCWPLPSRRLGAPCHARGGDETSHGTGGGRQRRRRLAAAIGGAAPALAGFIRSSCCGRPHSCRRSREQGRGG